MYNAKKYAASVAMGKEAEETFVELAKTRNYSVTKATLQQDRMEHWDYELSKTINNNFFKRKIDVKAMKKINRSDEGPTDRMFLIELNNVGGGKGWLYGQADGFAFQLTNGFILIPKDDLIKQVESLVDVTADSKPSTSNKKEHVIYDRKRWGNKDRFVYIKKEDLLAIRNTMLWSYNE